MKDVFSGFTPFIWFKGIKNYHETTAEMTDFALPTFNAKDQSYSFKILRGSILHEDKVYYELNATEFNPPDPDSSLVSTLISQFIAGTTKWFTVPLVLEKVLRRLRHELGKVAEYPSSSGWFSAQYTPSVIIIKPTEIILQWVISSFKPAEPQIPSNFLLSTTPRAASPEQVPEVRTIQVHDGLIPVGDIPLSDLPPLNFGSEESPFMEEDPVKEESKRRLREAKLKVALAKLKAQRMEQKYYERYGEELEESESSDSDFSDSVFSESKS